MQWVLGAHSGVELDTNRGQKGGGLGRAYHSPIELLLLDRCCARFGGVQTGPPLNLNGPARDEMRDPCVAVPQDGTATQGFTLHRTSNDR